MTITILFSLFLLGVVVGFINIVSAGGSLITLPMLIFFGLPPTVANGTNRIAILVQNIFAMQQFYKKRLINWKLYFSLSLPAVIGSILGAQFAIDISDKYFNNILAFIMIILIVLMTVKPHTYVKPKENSILLKYNTTFLIIGFAIIGFYGGFIQAGVGFLIIITLTILRKEIPLVEMHSIKTFVITIYLLISTFVFIYYGQINWTYAIILSIGSGIGGSLGGRFATRVSETVLKIIMIVIVILLASYLIFIK